MEKLQFIKATSFPDKHNPNPGHNHPIEILIPVEAIACLEKDLQSPNSYRVRFKKDYPFPLPFTHANISAYIEPTKVQIL